MLKLAQNEILESNTKQQNTDKILNVLTLASVAIELEIPIFLGY